MYQVMQDQESDCFESIVVGTFKERIKAVFHSAKKSEQTEISANIFLSACAV